MFQRRLSAAAAPLILAVVTAGCGASSKNSASVSASKATPATTSSSSNMPGSNMPNDTSSNMSHSGTSNSSMSGSHMSSSGSSSSMSMMEAHTGARVSVSSPAPGTVVTGEAVPFQVALSHFKVDCSSAGTPDQMGVGHYHVTLDGSLINMYCGPSDQVSMLDVKPGKHMLGFIPASNEHADDMKAARMVPIVYQPAGHMAMVGPLHFPGKPQIEVLSPKPGETVHGTLTMRTAVKNFRLSCAMYGKPDVAGYGHWHLNVDSTTMGMMGMGTMLRMSCEDTLSFSLAHIKPGTHRFYAILEDNQHAPTPKAMASVSVNVG